MHTRRVVILAAIAVFIAAFSIYLTILYRQLTTAFTRQEEYVPTRIFSDVTRLAPAQPRFYVDARLRALGYQPVSADENELDFRLHAIEYPRFLIPDSHPTFSAENQLVKLKFDGPEKDALVEAITVQDQEIPEIYLEPELVATLSRTGTQEKKVIRSWVQFDDIPAQIWQAIISVEDPRFLEHKGLDPRGIARAIFVNLKTLSFRQGGSTLSMQLVKNLMQRHSRNIVLKVNELFLTLLLEATYSKEAILERYLNEVYLGQVGNFEVHGVAEGARHFFGKDIKDLNLGEIALMAGLIRGPYYYSPYRYKDRAMERQKIVLGKMVETGQIAQEEMQAALKEPVRLAPQQTASNKAPYFTDFVKAELIRRLKDRGIGEQEVADKGFRVYTTLDMTMNSIAQDAVASGVAAMEKRLKLKPQEKLEGALAAVDQSTGMVRALIGGRSYAESTFNRVLNMKRQVGSTFKPFVYLAAIEKGTDAAGVPYGPAYPVEDAPWTLKFDHGRQTWTPRNYEKEFLGWIPMRTALAHSINTVAAKLGHEVGVANIILAARSLGIESALPQVPSLALGVAELSPMELLRAYATIANHGSHDELTLIRLITQDADVQNRPASGSDDIYAWFEYHPKQAVEPASADLLSSMLESIFTEGTARGAQAMGFNRAAAGKTGTTSNYRDAWFAGFTPHLTAVVWVGMDQMPSMPAGENGEEATAQKPTRVTLTGAGAALPIWVDFMKRALVTEPPTPFPVSDGLVDVPVDRHSGKRARSDCPALQVVTDKYTKAHEPKDESCDPAWPASVPETVAD